MTAESAAPRGTQTFEPVETGRVQAVQYDGTAEHARQIVRWVGGDLIEVVDGVAMFGDESTVYWLRPGRWVAARDTDVSSSFSVLMTDEFTDLYQPVADRPSLYDALCESVQGGLREAMMMSGRNGNVLTSEVDEQAGIIANTVLDRLAAEGVAGL